MKCIACKKDIPDDACYCPNCQLPYLIKTACFCGFISPQKYNFCPNCRHVVFFYRHYNCLIVLCLSGLFALVYLLLLALDNIKEKICAYLLGVVCLSIMLWIFKNGYKNRKKIKKRYHLHLKKWREKNPNYVNGIELGN